MNKYFKEFLHRGLIFAGFGPIIIGIIYAILERTLADFSLSGTQVFLGIISIYLLAFVHAGASVFNQIEEWPIAKSLGFHLATLYLAYTACYLLNSWIPLKAQVILIYTAIFLAVYFVIWLTVYIAVRLSSKKLNAKIK